MTQAWLRQKSPRPDSGRKRVWVCVFPVLHEHTEHWAGGALCSLVFSFSWPLALASTACFLQSRLLEAMALLYSLCRAPGTVRPWPGPWLEMKLIDKMCHCPLEPLASKEPLPSGRTLSLSLQCHGFDGISGRVWGGTQTPPWGAGTARGCQSPVWNCCAGFSAHRMCAPRRNPCSGHCTAEPMGFLSFSAQMNSKEYQP